MSMLWIERESLKVITAEADRSYPNETGGILVGYAASQNQHVASGAIGPGPKAFHHLSRFEPDHPWQCKQLDVIYDQSSGSLVYLGDWHTHPRGSVETSRLDRRTLRGLSRHLAGQSVRPIMLIGGGTPDSWAWAAYQYRSDLLWGISIQCEKLAIRLFDAE